MTIIQKFAWAVVFTNCRKTVVLAESFAEAQKVAANFIHDVLPGEVDANGDPLEVSSINFVGEEVAVADSFLCGQF